jgi:polysaccharide export outer membrane protein
MKRTARLIPVLLIAALSGCAVAPGLSMDASRFKVADDEAADVAAVEPELIAITPRLLKAQAAARAERKTAVAVQNAAAEPIDTRYRVGAGDVLTITVWDHPELTIPAGEFRPAESAGHLVNAEGAIFYPYVGEVVVAGQTTDAIRGELTRRLKTFIQEPQLDVRVAAFRSQKSFITGEVAKPGVIPITDRPITVLEAVNLSGGATAEADLHNVLVTRGDTVTRVDLQGLYQGNGARDVVLRDGDQVHVPDRYYNKVFVLGEVKRPAAQYMDRGRLSLADALGVAEGVDPLSADTSRIYVIRGDFEQPKVYQLDASSADALLLATGFELQPQDVVYVSIAGISRWNRLMSQILPTIQAIYQTDVLIQRNR